MIVLRCKHCQARIQVPSPGIYKCHSCGEVLEVNIDEVKKMRSSRTAEKTVNLEGEERSHIGPTCRHHPGAPAEKFCTSCGDFLCDNCAIKVEHRYYCRSCLARLRNEEEVNQQKREIPEGESSIPLENYRKTGFIKAFFLTIKKGIVEYPDFYDRTKPSSHLGLATFVMVVIQFLNKLVDYIAYSNFNRAPAIDTTDMPERWKEIIEKIAIPTFESLALSPVTAVVSLVILAGIYHIAVMIVGGKEGYLTTYKITAYSTIAQIFTAILYPVPVLPFLLVFVFTLLLIIQGCVKMHNLSDGKAIFVALFPIIVGAVLLGLAILSMSQQS